MNTTELIEIAIEVADGAWKNSDNKPVVTFLPDTLQKFAQRIEQPHLQRIAELELALQKQAKAALLGMDAAKANADAMLKAATEIQSQLKPELLDSERQANAALTEENENLQQQIEQLREALQGFMGIIADSKGVAGYHLNGAIAEWGEFGEVDTATKVLEQTK